MWRGPVRSWAGRLFYEFERGLDRKIHGRVDFYSIYVYVIFRSDGRKPLFRSNIGGDMTINTELLSRITARPDVFGGKPIIRDMRISVEIVLSLLAKGVSTDAILEDYPELEPDDIRACAAYAHACIARDSLDAIAVADS